jgi:L-amino acid N-acyltransferase YncA
VADLLGQLVAARTGWTSPVIRSWYSESGLEQNLRLATAEEAERLGNAAFGRELRDGVGIGEPADPLAWANRLLDLPEGGWALTGIRFRGRDVHRPFVDVVATTASPTGDGLAVIVDAVMPAYREFSPLCLRVDAPDGSALVEDLHDDPRFGPGCAVDMHVVAGLVDALRLQPRVPTYSRVRLRAGDPQTLAPRVAEIYRDLVAEEPELATWANPEDVESLSQCAGEGLLFEVLADDVPAGVVAGLRFDAHAMTGFSVQEVCLDVAHRGQRLAPAAVQRLVDELPARPGDVLWGTIDPSNSPSLRSALSIGRTVVGGYVWVAPVGMTGIPV